MNKVDYATLISALRELFEVQIPITQIEVELGKALASLERTPLQRTLCHGQAANEICGSTITRWPARAVSLH